MEAKDLHKIYPAFEIDFNFNDNSPKKEENAPMKKDKLILGQEFQVILKVLRIFGNSPLLYNKKEGKFEFR